MPFKDINKGQTHYQGDGCADKHGREPNKKEHKIKKSNCTNCGLSVDFITQKNIVECDNYQNQKEQEWKEKRYWIVDDKNIGHSGKLHEKSIIDIKELLQSERSKTLEEVEEEIDKISIDPLREKREGVRGHLLNLFKEKLKGRQPLKSKERWVFGGE